MPRDGVSGGIEICQSVFNGKFQVRSSCGICSEFRVVFEANKKTDR
jgi:hypothetical protein